MTVFMTYMQICEWCIACMEPMEGLAVRTMTRPHEDAFHVPMCEYPNCYQSADYWVPVPMVAQAILTGRVPYDAEE